MQCLALRPALSTISCVGACIDFTAVERVAVAVSPVGVAPLHDALAVLAGGSGVGESARNAAQSAVVHIRQDVRFANLVQVAIGLTGWAVGLFALTALANDPRRPADGTVVSANATIERVRIEIDFAAICCAIFAIVEAWVAAI